MPPRSTAWKATTNVLLVLVLSPIFFGIQHRDILLFRIFSADHTLQNVDRYDNAISIIAFAAVALSIPLIPAFVRRILKGDGLFVAATLGCLYFVGIAMVQVFLKGDPYPLLGAAQYVLPVLCVPIGYLLAEKYEFPLLKMLAIYAAMNIALPAAIFLYYHFVAGERVFASLSLTSDIFYGLYSIIPTMVMIALFFILFVSRRFFVASVLTMLALFLIVWSRSGTIAVFVSSIAAGLLLVWDACFRGIEASRAKVLLPICLCLAVGSYAVPSYGLIGLRSSSVVAQVEAPQVSEEEAGTVGEPAYRPAEDDPDAKQGQATKTESWLDVSNESRWAYATEGLKRWRETPVFGIMFKPEYPTVIYRYVVDKKQIFQPHNQYLDILLKTGIVGLAFFALYYLCYVGWPIAKTIFSPAPVQDRLTFIGWASILVGLAVVANFQNFFTTWTSGVPISVLTGYMLRKAAKATSQAYVERSDQR